MQGTNTLDTRSGIISRADVFDNDMELRSPERPEPSHIHIPRPSRTEVGAPLEGDKLAVLDCECARTLDSYAPRSRLH